MSILRPIGLSLRGAGVWAFSVDLPGLSLNSEASDVTLAGAAGAADLRGADDTERRRKSPIGLEEVSLNPLSLCCEYQAQVGDVEFVADFSWA